MTIRDASADDLEALTDLWYDGWRDAHVAIVPADLTALRTRENFYARLAAALADVRLADAGSAPAGFYLLRDAELNQFYIAPASRGTGLAARLIADAETHLSARGIRVAWLACAIGNDRAARFYEKSGWRRIGTVVQSLTTPAGPYDLPVWRYEKAL